jgi:hypothetical protein
MIAKAQQPFFRTYGGGYYDAAYSIQETPDSGYIVAGVTSSYGLEESDVLIFKTDRNGQQQWMKMYGGSGSDGAKKLMKAPGGNGFILAGHTNSYGAGQYDFYVVYIDLNGDTLWTKTFGGSDWDMAYDIDTTFDQNIIVTGETSSFGNGNKDVWVIKIDLNGNIIWSQTIGGVEDDFATRIFQDRDSNIVALGETSSGLNNNKDFYFVKLNSAGDTLFTKIYGTPEEEWFTSGDLYFDNSDNMSYCIGGNRYVAANDITIDVLYRLDINGNFLYSVEGSPLFPYERLQTIVKNEGLGGKFYAAYTYKDDASTKYQISFRRTSYGFSSVVHATIFGTSKNEFTYDIIKTFDSSYVIVGMIENFGPGPYACFMVKTDSLGATTNTPVMAMDEMDEHIIQSVYPNPAREKIYISLPDDLMKKIKSISFIDASGSEKINLSESELISNLSVDILLLNPGCYWIRMITLDRIYTVPIIKVE